MNIVFHTRKQSVTGIVYYVVTAWLKTDTQIITFTDDFIDKPTEADINSCKSGLKEVMYEYSYS